tara:strand:- start:692 stop:913 length:222 start_codon:yes stop_codon:yes gene_type:complete
MITNDQMITQILRNVRNLNNQINDNIEILSRLDRMSDNSMNLHDQVAHIMQGHETLTNGTRNALSVHGVEIDE